MKKMLTACLMLVSLLTFGTAKYREKIALKVLYVGYNPDKAMPKNVVYYSTTPNLVEKYTKPEWQILKPF